MRRFPSLQGPLVPLLLIAAFTVGAAVAGDRRRFWMDELITLEALRADTLGGCVAFVAGEADGNPPLYHVLAKLYGTVFGYDEVSLRALSGFFVGLACVVARAALLRAFGPVAATLAVAATFAISPLTLGQAIEARSYGLFLLVSACSLAAFGRYARGGGGGTLAVYAVLQGASVLTHTFGFLYGGVAIAAALLSRAFSLKRVVALGVATLVGWTAFLPWLDAFRADFDVGKPWSWIPIPTLGAFADSLAHGVMLGPVTASIVFVGAVATALARRAPSTPPSADAPPPDDGESLARERTWIAFGAATIVLPPVVAFVASRTLTSVFLDRYMIPSVLGYATLFAAIARRMLPRGDLAAGPLSNLVCVAAFLGFCAVPTTLALRMPKIDASAIRAAAENLPDIPVVFEAPHGYLPGFHYGPRGNRCFYVLDWEAAIAEGNARNATVDFKIMSAFRRLAPRHNVLTTEEIFARFPKFYVSDLSQRRWSEVRVESNPEFKVARVGENLLLVERVAPPTTTKISAPDSR